MELSGTIKGRGALAGSFDFDQADYNLLKNKPSINGVELIGNKTSEDLHIETGGGGGGGTSNYNDLENKPKINDVILQDELSLHSLGIQAKIEFPEDSTKYLDGEGNFTTPPGGYTPPDFIIGEVNTGIKWIDGKDIYRKGFTISATINSTGVNVVANPGDIETLIRGTANEGTQAAPCVIWIGSGYIKAATVIPFYATTLIIEYTKI